MRGFICLVGRFPDMTATQGPAHRHRTRPLPVTEVSAPDVTCGVIGGSRWAADPPRRANQGLDESYVLTPQCHGAVEESRV